MSRAALVAQRRARLAWMGVLGPWVLPVVLGGKALYNPSIPQVPEVMMPLPHASRRSFLTVVVAWLFATWAPAASSQWHVPQRLSLGGALGDVGPVDVCAWGARALAVWSDARLGERRLFYRATEDFGLTWADEDVVPWVAGDALDPALACDGRFFYLAWAQRAPDKTTGIHFARYDGSRWTPPALVATERAAGRPRLAVTRAFPQVIGLVYEQSSDPTRAMWTRSLDGGATWTQPQPIARHTLPTGQPAIAAGSEMLYIAWRDFREGTAHIFVNRARDTLLDAERRVSQVGGSRLPALDAAGGRVLATWESQPSAAGANIYAALSVNEGRDWGAPAAVTDSPAQSIFASPVVLEDAAFVAWQDGQDGNWRVRVAQVDPEAGTAPPPTPAGVAVSGADVASVLPRLAAGVPDGAPRTEANAQLLLVWVQRREGREATAFASTRDALPPAPPAVPSHVDISAPPEWDDDGDLLFRWEPVPSATRYRVLAALGDERAKEVGTTEDSQFSLRVENGATVRVSVQAEDAVGNVGLPSSPSRAVRVDSLPPRTVIHEPRAGATLFDTTSVRVSCEEENLRWCVVEWGETAAPTRWTVLAGPFTDPFPARVVAEWDVRGLRGLYTLRVSAADLGGNEAAQAVTLRIDTSAPLPVAATDSRPLLPPSVFASARRAPAWSPTGALIAFVSDEGGTQDIWVARPDGTGARQVTRDVFLDESPAWSPDGSRLAYSSRRDNGWDVYVVPAEGGAAVPLIAAPGDDGDPAWSPEGDRLAFASNLDGDFEVYVLENVEAAVRGGAPRIVQLTRNPWQDTRPTWSRDGRFIVFQSAREGSWDLWRVRPDTGVSEPLVRSPQADTDARYAPNGKQLLFTRDAGGGQELYVLDAVQGGIAPLSSAGAPGARGDWAPDGSAVVFEAGENVVVARLTSPTSGLTARISAPSDGAFLAPVTDVRGVARGDVFRSHRLEFAPAERPSAWQPLTGVSTSPVEREGFLARWDTRGLQGAYVLRLTVEGVDGSVAADEVRVRVRGARPQLDVREPADGLETLAAEVLVAGSAEEGAVVDVAGERAALDGQGRFRVLSPVAPGENSIRVRARNVLGEESSVVRVVRRVVSPLALVVEAPNSFALLDMPYVEVRGVAPRARRVEVNGVEVQRDADGRFSRAVGASDAEASILVRATDDLGRERVEMRRVFRSTRRVEGPDTVPPALVDADPPFGSTVPDARVHFRARILDDRALDPATLALSFDGELLDEADWSFNAATDELRYEPDVLLPDGEHRLTVAGRDIAGNAILFGDWRVAVDTRGASVSLSAALLSVGALRPPEVRVLLTANRPLRVASAQAVLPGQTVGYPLTLTPVRGEPPFSYEATFALPFGRAVRLSADVSDDRGRRREVTGHFAVETLAANTAAVLVLADGVSAEFPPDRSARPRQAVLRTQDGLDLAAVLAQRDDARDRQLGTDVPGTAVYAVEAAEGAELPPFHLSAPDTRDIPRAWFLWDEAAQRWAPLPEQEVAGGRRTAPAPGAGIYALLGDQQPPALLRAHPSARATVPLDRHVVEAEFGDVGSGVDAAGVRAFVDGGPVEVDVDADLQRAVVRYVPTDLRPGLHALSLEAPDRAGNVARVSLDYLTQEVFTFTAAHVAPNPLREKGWVLFRLTRTADVTLHIYSSDGALVYADTVRQTAGDLSIPPSRRAFSWDGANMAGRRVANGVYLVRVTAREAGGAAVQRTLKWAVLRSGVVGER